jgi:crotonobetainyl-CoA:carnitine CoA-transferase CaiB-like acyl-CoA transferase
VAHRDDLHGAIAKAFATRPADARTAELAAVGVPVRTVKTLDQVYDSPRVAAEDLTLDIEHASLGTIRLPGRPLKFGRTALPVPLAPPTLGQHDDDVRENL